MSWGYVGAHKRVGALQDPHGVNLGPFFSADARPGGPSRGRGGRDALDGGTPIPTGVPVWVQAEQPGWSRSPRIPAVK